MPTKNQSQPGVLALELPSISLEFLNDSNNYVTQSNCGPPWLAALFKTGDVIDEQYFEERRTLAIIYYKWLPWSIHYNSDYSDNRGAGQVGMLMGTGGFSKSNWCNVD